MVIESCNVKKHSPGNVSYRLVLSKKKKFAKKRREFLDKIVKVRVTDDMDYDKDGMEKLSDLDLIKFRHGFFVNYEVLDVAECFYRVHDEYCGDIDYVTINGIGLLYTDCKRDILKKDIHQIVFDNELSAYKAMATRMRNFVIGVSCEVMSIKFKI